MFGLSNDLIVRYSRNIILKEIGGQGQQKLRQARVLIVGAGGLGAPASLYLAAAGIGAIGIIDDDDVDLSNLQRQIFHRTRDIGTAKVDSARRALTALNPDVSVETYHMRLDGNNVMDLIGGYDIVVSGVDNFPTRYLVNDACVIARKPLIEAGILRWSGMVMTIQPGTGPCYRCVFPEPPPEGSAPTCQEAGVIGALAGVIGSIQALETIKTILGAGKSLAGRLLLFDALEGESRPVTVGRNVKCPVCGDTPTITEPAAYDDACGLRRSVSDGRSATGEQPVTQSGSA